MPSRKREPLRIRAVRFMNFKALKSAVLPLEQFTLLVGPNGSGKSTAFQALLALKRENVPTYETVASAGGSPGAVEVVTDWTAPPEGLQTRLHWTHGGGIGFEHRFISSSQKLIPAPAEITNDLYAFIGGIRYYALDP